MKLTFFVSQASANFCDGPLHIQRTKGKRGNKGGGGGATHGKIEEKTGDESQLSSVRRKLS